MPNYWQDFCLFGTTLIKGTREELEMLHSCLGILLKEENLNPVPNHEIKYSFYQTKITFFQIQCKSHSWNIQENPFK